MKYLIAGLGNPGPEYRDTRHNVGFMVLEQLIFRFGASAQSDRYAQTALIRHKGRMLHLIMPMTYMNLSGKAVRYYMEKLDLTRDQLLVIVDDLALPAGQVRLRPKGSDGGHNGLKSINELLGYQEYARLRIGIGSDFPQGRQADYVLSPFTAEEWPRMREALTFCEDAVLSFATAGLSLTMNQINSRK
ncbi:MAG: aminoacyl-tRNA hydrolase [Bacteroidia bacterium]|nr:aminoacyl-tRNA hydrolase [Bacteroidia bacterium]